MLFDKIRTFFTRLFGHPETEQNLLNQQERQHQKLKEALVQLIFQRKQTEQQIQRLSQQVSETEQDLKMAAEQDKDDLAIHLMQQAESQTAEMEFLKGHLEKIMNDIELAQTTEKELLQKMQVAQTQLRTLSSRKRILQARKSVHQQMASTSLSPDQALEKVQRKILQLEAENEALDQEKPWKKDLEKMREERKNSGYQSKLMALKQRLNQRQITYSGELQPVTN